MIRGPSPIESGSALLAERIARAPDELQELLETEAPSGSLHGPGPVITTGAGASEGPARVLAATLRAGGTPARFEPLSAFASERERTRMVATNAELVLVSQSLSPNARLALRRASLFRAFTVVTSVSPDAHAPPLSAPALLATAANAGARIVTHGPKEEPGLLVRVLGPVSATLAVLRLAGATPPGELVERYRQSYELGKTRSEALGLSCGEHPGGGAQTIAFLTAGSGASFAHGHRWKLLEACAAADPPVWDVLQFAHGPFQQIYERPMLLLGLERLGDEPLFERFYSLLVPERHRFLRVQATLPEPWSFFEHDAQLNALALTLLALRPRDLMSWPGQGADGPLYDFTGDDDT